MADTTSAGSVSLSVKPDATGFGTSLSSLLRTEAGGIGAELGGMILSGLSTFAAPIAALIAGFGIKHVIDDSVQAFEDLAGSVRDMQRITGGTTEQVSGLRGAMQLAGMNADNTTAAFRIFSTHLQNATTDSASLSAMQQTLGGSFTDAAGNIKPMAEILPMVAEKFKEMPNGAEKTALAVELFGRSGTQMIPILNKGSEGMAELTAQAKSAGLVIDDLSLNTFVEARKAAREYTADVQGVKVALGADLIPVVDGVQNIFRKSFGPVLQDMTRFLQDHREAFYNVARTIEDFGTRVAPGVKSAFDAIGGVLVTVFGSMKDSVGGFFDSMQPTFVAVGDMFKQLGPVFSGLLPQVLQLVSAFSPFHLIFEALKPVLPGIVTSVSQLAVSLGGALGNALSTLLPVITQVVSSIVGSLAKAFQALMPSLPPLIDLIGKIAGILADALGGALGQIMPVIGQLITLLIDTTAGVLVQLMPTILDLAKIIVDVFQKVLVALMPVIGDLIKFLVEVLQSVMPLIPAILNLVMAFMPLIPPILQIVTTLLPPLIELFSMIVRPVLAIVDALVAWLVPAFSLAISIVTAVVNVLMLVLRPAFDILAGAVGWLGDIFGSVFRGIGDVATGIFEAVAGGIKGLVNGIIWGVNKIIDLVNGITGLGKAVGINIPVMAHIPELADGGIVPATPGGRIVKVAEAGEDEAVIPLSKLNGMNMGSGKQTTVNYYAAPNQSLSGQEALSQALRRSRILAGW